MLIKVQYQS